MSDSQAPMVIVTGASSDVGLSATEALAKHGRHVVMACRNRVTARSACAARGIASASVTLLHQ